MYILRKFVSILSQIYCNVCLATCSSSSMDLCAVLPLVLVNLYVLLSLLNQCALCAASSII